MEIIQTLIGLLVVAFLFIFTAAIEINYNKKRIKELEIKLSESENKYAVSERKVIANLEEIKLLKWQIANPPKHKKGDKVDDFIITSCKVCKPTISGLMAKGIVALISIAAGFQPENPKDFFEMSWEYELTHTISGDKKKMREAELTHLSNKK